MKVLAIIPARGGSKGIPFKNIQKLAGKPLIQHTIETAKKSRSVDRIIVSTDDENIAKIAKRLDVEVPFLRPKKIAKDKSPTIEVIKHAINWLIENEKYEPDIIVLLQPTSPQRTSTDIDNSIKILKKTNASSVIEVMKIKKNPNVSFEIKKKKLIPVNKEFEKYYQRQISTPLFFPTGSIYTFWLSTFKKYNSIYGPKIYPLYSEDYNNDIDTMFDLFINEMKIKHWEKFKRRTK